MAEAIGIEMAANATEGAISKLWQEFRCWLKYSSNIKKLKAKVKVLQSERDTVQMRVDDAKRHALVIVQNVLIWTENVDTINREIREELLGTSNTQRACLYCKCPKLRSRYRLSKLALERTTEVNELQNGSRFDLIGIPAPPGRMPYSSPGEFVGYLSRIKNSDDIMEALKDNAISKIGICGMAGVGKTTLVKKIADEVKGKIFDEVVMAVVTDTPVIENIQNQLAEILGLTFIQTTDFGRADQLYTRLKDPSKRVLLVFDDVWQPLDFHKIGIPVEDNSMHIQEEKGRLKVLLTSRKKSVCTNMKAITIEVNVLSKEDSWHLFKETADISEEANEIKNIAEQVAKECGGLPLAIKIVGSALKGKGDYDWREALRELKVASMTNIADENESMLSKIKVSYKYLKDHSKLLLLLCSLFPEDYNIELEDLVRYVNGLQLFRNVETMAQARDKVYSIADELKNCYLLLEGNTKNHVKLHDVVRDGCMSIASSGEHVHMVRHGRFMELPQEDNYASTTAISLTVNKIDQLPSVMEYPKLKLLKLIFQEGRLDIREYSFERMKDIKVLELFNLRSELPSSLQALVKLRTLCLHNCSLYGDLSVLGNQKELEILSFYNSYLQHFPHNISKLRNLKSLDLRFMGPPLPSGILSSMQKLEELYLGDYFQELHSEEDDSVIITKICSLQNLQTLQLNAHFIEKPMEAGHRPPLRPCVIHFWEQFLEKLHAEKLIKFEITNSNDGEGVGNYQLGEALIFKRINVDLLKTRAAKCLLSKAEDLNLEVKGLSNLVNELDIKGFVNLKRLNLENCDLQFLVDATSFPTNGGGAFINLEELFIREAKDLEELCHGNLPLGSFAKLRKVRLHHLPALKQLWDAIEYPCLKNLKILEIRRCGSLRSLFCESSLKYTPQLQENRNEDCQELEQVVSNKEEDEKDTRYVEFPILESLCLHNVNSFKSFGPESDSGALFEKVMLPNLDRLEISWIYGIRCIVDGRMPIGSLSKLQTITIRRCDGLVHVIASGDANKLLQSLQQLEVQQCKSVEVVFDFKGLNVEGTELLEIPLARLESMKLYRLPKLKQIWRMLPEGTHAFKNLKSLYLFHCDSLRYLLSPSMAKLLVSLEMLKLERCENMESIIQLGEKEITEIESTEMKNNGVEESTNKIVFPKLRSIEAQRLDNFRMLCSVNVDLELPSLTGFVIEECSKMTKFSAGRVSASRLKIIEYHFNSNYTGVRLDEFGSWLKDCESRIRCLGCSSLREEVCDHLD